MTWATGLMTQKRNQITAILFAVLISIASVVTALTGLVATASAADQTARWTDKKNIMMVKRVYKYTGEITIEGDPAQKKQAYKFTPDTGGCPSYIYFDSRPTPGDAVTGRMASTFDSDGGTDNCKNFPGTTSVKIAAGTVPEVGVVTGKDPAPEEMPEPAAPTCDAGGWSWMICPLIESTSEVLEWVNDFIAGLSYFTPLPIGAPNGEAKWAIFRAWSVFLTFANIVAVIAFLAIIFSQATSVGISTYGIKKLLPRIIAALILMNLSYYIAALLVDLSNLAGVGVNNLFNAILSQIQAEGNTDLYDGGWSDDAFATVLGMGSIGLIIILGGFMVPILIAAFAVFLTLAARIAIIILLVVVAPLAFAAWILPNTEKYFTKWWSLFISMLVLYPLLMAIQGGATLASRILLEVGQAGGTFDNILPFVAVLVQALPLLAIPFVIRTASGSLGKIYDMSQRNARKYGGDQADSAFKGMKKRQLSNLGARMASNKIGYNADGSPKNDGRFRGGKLRRGIGKTAAFTGGYKARRDFKISTQESNAKRAQQDQISGLLEHDLSFARRAAGVGGEAGTLRAQAMGIEAQDRMIAEEMKAGQTVIENAGLTNRELQNLGMYGKAYKLDDDGNEVLDENGQRIVKLQGKLYQNAAIGKIIPTAQISAVDNLVKASNQMDDDTRAILAYHLQQNYSPTKQKGHMFNNDQLKVQLNTAKDKGGAITDQVLMQASAEATRLNPAQFATQDASALKHLRAALANNMLSSENKDKVFKLVNETLNDPMLQGTINADSRQIMVEIDKSLRPKSENMESSGPNKPSGGARGPGDGFFPGEGGEV